MSMSLEIFETVDDSESSGEVIELFGLDAVVRRRKALQDKLGKLSIILNDVNTAYNECIQEIIKTNDELATAESKGEDIDTQALARNLQSGVIHPAIR